MHLLHAADLKSRHNFQDKTYLKDKDLNRRLNFDIILCVLVFTVVPTAIEMGPQFKISLADW